MLHNIIMYLKMFLCRNMERGKSLKKLVENEIRNRMSQEKFYQLLHFVQRPLKRLIES